MGSVHDRLARLEQSLQDVSAQNTHLGHTQTALLQASISLVEAAHKIDEELERIGARLAGSHGTLLQSIEESEQRSIRELRATIEGLGTTLREAKAGILAELEQLANHTAEETRSSREQTAQQVAALASKLDDHASATRLATIQDSLDRLAVFYPKPVEITTSSYVASNPEAALMCYLFSFLDSRVALDVGANRGDVTELLVSAGFEVHAFEPEPTAYKALQRKMRGQESCRVHNWAIGSTRGKATLNRYKDVTTESHFGDTSAFNSILSRDMPAGLDYADSVEVAVETISDLCRSNLVSSHIGLLKIDTEGYDLEVIRGLNDIRPSVIVAEYWDTANPFGRSGTLYTFETLIQEMRSRDYFWHIDMMRFWGNSDVCFACNHATSASNSWGNLFFFRNRQQFEAAHQWCSAILPRTIFKLTQPAQ